MGQRCPTRPLIGGLLSVQVHPRPLSWGQGGLYVLTETNGSSENDREREVDSERRDNLWVGWKRALPDCQVVPPWLELQITQTMRWDWATAAGALSDSRNSSEAPGPVCVCARSDANRRFQIDWARGSHLFEALCMHCTLTDAFMRWSKGDVLSRKPNCDDCLKVRF